jgi:four helix bundle protein
MGEIKRFEDLDVWQEARIIVQHVYRATSDRDYSRDLSLRDQVRRAAVSMMANIAEWFSRRSNREFVQYLFIAKASAAEVQNHLYVALDQGYVSQEQFQRLYDRIDRYAHQVSALITYLISRRHPKTPQTQQTPLTQQTP